MLRVLLKRIEANNFLCQVLGELQPVCATKLFDGLQKNARCMFCCMIFQILCNMDCVILTLGVVTSFSECCLRTHVKPYKRYLYVSDI